MSLSASTQRSARSAFHALLAALAILPLLTSGLGGPEKGAAVVAAVAVVSKVINMLEDAGVIPGWLKGDASTPAVPGDAASGDAAP